MAILSAGQGARDDQERPLPYFRERPVWERKVVTIGFTATYSDDGAESDGIALAGSIRLKSMLRLLVPD